MVTRIATALGIPVLTVGLDRSNAFDTFRDALSREVGALGIGQAESCLLDRALPATFFIAPHFSHYAAFQKCGLQGWNERLAAFVDANPSIATPAGNPSWHKIQDCDGETMAKNYMFDVLLGNQDTSIDVPA